VLLNIRPGIGLDIGSQKTKLIGIRQWNRHVSLVTFGSIPTPAGVIEAGYILDPVSLGEELGKLVTRLKLKGKKVVAALTGPQVYTRSLIMPQMKLREMRESAYYQATTFLPIPIEELTIDIFPLRNFSDDEGKKTEVFFVAVRRQQVDNLSLACRIAGLKLAVVEIEPLALFRALGRSVDIPTQAFLNIGPARSYFAVFWHGVLVYYRSFTWECSALKDSDSNKAVPALDGKTVAGNRESLFKDLTSEVLRSWEYYHMQKERDIGRVVLCGGGSRFPGLGNALSVKLGRDIEIADTIAGLKLTGNIKEWEINDLKYDYPVALGLALRQVI
jgi:type IV pilus assembly protein PilM